MKKKVLSGLLALCLVFGSASALPQGAFTDSATINASAEVEGNWEYEVQEDGTVAITKYNGSESEITIPATLGGKKIDAVYNCFSASDKITSVTVSEGITGLLNTFYGCSKLESVKLPNTLKSIGFITFESCSSLKSITIPESVTSIAENAFRFSGIESIVIPKNITKIEKNTFAACKNLKSITIPGNVKTVDARAFEACTSLEKAVIESGVTNIGTEAFYACEKLTDVSIDSSVKSIGGSAFESTKWLENQKNKDPFVVVNGILISIDSKKLSGDIIIPSSVTKIGDFALAVCRNIKSVSIPNSVTSIGDGSFLYCTELRSINIPNTVNSIGSNAFNYCKNLSSVIVPASVKNIGGRAFGYYLDSTSSDEKIKDFTIYGAKGTSAEQYATDNGFKFVEIDFVSRISGANRFATAAEISKASFKTADTVVLAYGLNYADALAGVTLANKLNAPILLTYTAKLPDETQAEIRRLGAKKVIILGGTGAISKDVENSLKKNGLTTERYAGTTRFGTATAIAEKLNDKPTDVFFVYAFNYADALSVSTVAALKNAPIIYLKTNGELDKDTADYLAKLKKAGSVKNVYVIGGEGVISKDMLNKAGKALGVTPTRVAGKNRYATCVEVNNKFKSVLTGTSVCVAKGLDFPDALAGGVFAAANKAPLFLADNTLKDEQKTYLKSKKADTFYVFGGTGAVPDGLVGEITKSSI